MMQNHLPAKGLADILEFNIRMPFGQLAVPVHEMVSVASHA